jgi:hypothetical protein
LSLKEQALFYGDIPDDDPIYYHDVEVRQGSPEELADAIEGFLTSAEWRLPDSGQRCREELGCDQIFFFWQCC